MRQVLIPGLLLLLISARVCGQATPTRPGNVADINQRIDDLVVAQDLVSLDSLYAADFVFNHGTGLIEGKEGWLKTVAQVKYISRRHDSVSTEVHPDLVIVRGLLNIQKQDPDRIDRYQLHYVRVFAWRNRGWQLVSHITTREQHEAN
jgi:ketosteroid isomerase-like protein